MRASHDGGRGVTVFTDIADFFYRHSPHGSVTTDATPPAWNRYRLTVSCPCGVVFARWVTPWDAELDLLPPAGLN